MFEQRRIAGKAMRPSLARKLARLHPDAVVTWFPPKRSWVILVRQKDGTLSFWETVRGQPTYANTVARLNAHSVRHFRSERSLRLLEESMDASQQSYLDRQQADAKERIREGADRIAHALDIGRRYRAQPWPSGPTPDS